MAQTDSSLTEAHIHKPDEQENTVVSEGKTHGTNNEDANSSTVSENDQQKEKINIENSNDSLSNVTHRLEDVHVTVDNENSVSDVQQVDTTTMEDKTHGVKDDTLRAIDSREAQLSDAANDSSENATESKNDAVAATHDAQEKAEETADDVEEKSNEIAADTKEDIIDGEKVAVDKLTEAKETVLEKSNELTDSVKQTAHETNVKAQELEKSGEQKVEETKEGLSEKASEVEAKGSEILEKTEKALAAGAAIVTEKAEAAAEVIGAKAEEVKDAVIAAAQTVVATVQEKTNTLSDSGKQELTSTSTSSPPTPSTHDEQVGVTTPVSVNADDAAQGASVTETSPQTAHGSQPVTGEQAAAVPKTNKGPFASVRSFFNRLFNSPSPRRKSTSNATTNATPQTADVTPRATTTTETATSNSPALP